MRTETDIFKEHEDYEDSDSICADICHDLAGMMVIGIEITESNCSSAVMLTRQQAIDFADQLLEMCDDD